MKKHDPYNQLREGTFEDLSDDDLRHKVNDLDMGNCTYAVQICRNCGMFYQHPDGDALKAEIVTRCANCVNDKQ